MLEKNVWRALTVTGIAATLILTPLCGLWFACGCDWPWAGLHTHCDALLQNPPKPHCPWCVQPASAGLAIGFAALASSFAVLRNPALRPGNGAAMLYSAGGGIIVFTLALAFTAWLTALWIHHPSFLGMPLR